MRFAENMIAVAVGWQVYAIHKNPLDLGLVGLCEFLPLPILALPAGNLADRMPRRLIAAFSLAIMVGVAGALLAVTVADPRRRLAVLPARRRDRSRERDRLAGEPGADPRGRPASTSSRTRSRCARSRARPP